MKDIKITVESEEYIDYAIQEAKESIKQTILDTLQDEKFITFMSEKLNKSLFDIAICETGTIGNDQISTDEVNRYLSSFNYEIRDNSIYLFNNAVIDVSSKNISPETLQNYQPPVLSLGKLIEYGFGYTGFANTAVIPNNWEYDVNGHGYRGWYYEDKNGQLHWTNGMEGRLVFLKMAYWLEEHAKELVVEYLKNNL